MRHLRISSPSPRPFGKSLRARGSAASPHRIAFLHDSRGNCLRALDTAGSAYFAWTAADLVDKIRWADGKANYFYYDARLRRFGMRDSDGLRYFTWDSGGMNLIAERSGAKAQTAAYAHGRTRLFRFDPARARR